MKAKWGTISVRKLKEQIIYIEKKRYYSPYLQISKPKFRKPE